MKALITLLILISATCAATFAESGDYISFDNVDSVILNPKPQNMDSLKILPPSQQASMITTAKPMVAHTNRGSSKGGENISLKGKRRTNSASKAFSKTKAERDNGLKDF